MAKARSIQPPQRVRQVVRFGRTNAVVTMRTLPSGTSALHFPRHRARPVASSSLYVLGLVLNVMRGEMRDGPASVERVSLYTKVLYYDGLQRSHSLT